MYFLCDFKPEMCDFTLYRYLYKKNTLNFLANFFTLMKATVTDAQASTISISLIFKDFLTAQALAILLLKSGRLMQIPTKRNFSNLFDIAPALVSFTGKQKNIFIIAENMIPGITRDNKINYLNSLALARPDNLYILQWLAQNKIDCKQVKRAKFHESFSLADLEKIIMNMTL